MPFRAQAKLEAADSIISRMHQAASEYMGFIHEYRAELYIKTQLDIIKKNKGFRFIPGLFRTEKYVNRYITETYNDLHFTSPNIYDQKIKAYTGTLKDPRNIPGVSEYFNVNIYAPYLLGQQLLSPLAPNSNKYYIYSIDSVSCDASQRLEYHIRFIPRNKSTQLLDGYMTVTDQVWSVRDIFFKGKAELLTFSCHIKMGNIGTDTEYLPVDYDIQASFGFAFNVVDGFYQATLKYKEIRTKANTPTDSIAQTDYNLSASFSLRTAPQLYKQDFTQFDTLRTYPLSQAEKNIYQAYRTRRGTAQKADSVQKPLSAKKRFWGSIGDFFLDDYKWNLADNTTLRCSPFINPLLFSYSKSNGIAYRQDLRFHAMLKKERSVHIGTRLGYNFKHKEFYWSIGSEYIYWPERQGKLRINVGNGNRIGNSRIIEELKEIPTDSILDFEKLNLDLFKDLNFEIYNHLEIINGLSLNLGLIFHKRTPIRQPDFLLHDTNLPENVAEGLNSCIRPRYNSFAPVSVCNGHRANITT